VFLDPFYSPGSDFIAISNTYIADLIARDWEDEAINGRAHIYQQLYFSFYESTLSLYTGQYPLFGDPEVMTVKIVWDYTYYWGVLCQLFFQRRLTDVAAISRISADLNHSKALNAAMQPLLREWSRFSAKSNAPVLFDQASLDWFAELNRSLQDELDDDAFRARIREYTALLDSLARQIMDRALRDAPHLDVAGLSALLRGTAESQPTLLFDAAA
jgi:hypothetical protein